MISPITNLWQQQADRDSIRLIEESQYQKSLLIILLGKTLNPWTSN